MMPSHMPSSFASAAAGQSSGRDARTGRGEGRGSGDWARPGRANGTVVLGHSNGRRSSTVHNSSSQADVATSAPNVEIPTSQQVSNSFFDQPTDHRYSKKQLLDLYSGQQSPESSNKDVSSLFMNGWDPGHSNGTNGRGWGKIVDTRDTHGPDVCWDATGSVQPINMEEMTDQESQTFSEDVNSPLKPPPQNSNKDPSAQGSNGRKPSVSYGANSNAFALSSPSSSRPSTRRQQTSDSIPGLGSPAGAGRFGRDDSSPYFSRKANDFKDGSEERADDSKPSLPLGPLMRSNTAGSVLGNGPVSPWGATPSSATMGNFGIFNPPTPGEKRPVFGRGESRLAHLMPKESSEDISSKAAERSWRSRPRTDTDPFGDDLPTGSAALGGGQDTSPPLASQRRAPGLDTPVRGVSSDFGMSDMPGFRDSLQRGQSFQTPQGHQGEHEHFSPSDTNPYRSPPDDRNEPDDESFDGETAPHSRVHGLGGIPEHGPNVFGTLPRGFPNAAFDGSDRSQTSSVGPSKGFPALGGGLPSLSGLGGIGGWPTSGNTIGTPDRENRPGYPSAFGNTIFGPAGDLQSPGFGGLGGMFGPTSSGNLTGSSTIGRGSKLGSLFPAAMQAQMQSNETDNSADGVDIRQLSGFGAIGRNTFPSRDTDSPMRAGRNSFEDLFPQTENSRNQGPFSSSETVQGQTATSMPQVSQAGYQQSQSSSESASNQLPTAQNRTMVMPDRMRWVYLDPQGHVQGPWSGLEMHDWYKASFFTPDLSVKKVEDTKFEPLGELIRRIGNSREPFLVPQIGIPHGPPTTQPGNAFTPAAAAPGNAAAQGGSVQPPFAGAFPSFGTTLTAEQQNNLERRKQEEQYLMARQREFLAQQQVNMKQLQMSGLPGSLHHHSSAHSLQSQPSFGSMTSPIGIPQQAPIPVVSGFFDGQPRQVPNQGTSGLSSDFFPQEELNRLSLQERQQLFGTGGQGSQVSHAQQINTMFSQIPDDQRDATRMEHMRQNDPQGFKARLREFEQLRAQHDLEEAAQSSIGLPSDLIGAQPSSQHQQYQEPLDIQPEVQRETDTQEPLSLTQQVQKAASAKQSPTSAPQPESPWGKVNSASLPTPFPAPQSTTPLPAPTAQRGRSNLPEALNVEIRSRSETPEVTAITPSVAPWAKEPTEAPKGPSLKEIQEAEAKKAAKAEELAAATRRTLHEQELKFMTNQPVAPAPGLPTTSTWGNHASPAGHAATPSAWANNPANKTHISTSITTTKKTLADIQREEESRKQKLAAAAAVAQPSQGVSGGKRYADLASKPSTTPGPTTGGSWATVGAGGKVKIPTGPAAAVPQTLRASSTATIATATSRASRPAPAARGATTSGPAGTTTAKDEFNKWARSALVGLNSNINVDEFISQISEFPLEAIADSVYANSQLIDGRHFANEFNRRRKLAEKGVIEPSGNGSGTSLSTAGDKAGWSEVAKKGPPKEESISGYKVVPNKKKGKK